MRTVKFFLIATFVSFAMISFSAVKPGEDKPEKSIAIEKALMSRGLIKAMNFQLTEDFISVEHPGLYYAKVRYHEEVIVIFGKLEAWKKYFRERKWVSRKALQGNRITH